jgi:AraC family transcriptional regulator
LNGKIRFSQVREPGTFQVARAGETVSAVLTDRSGRCLDLYLPHTLLEECLERDFENAGGGLELLEIGVERDVEIARLAKAVAAELEAPDVAASVAIDAAALSLCVALIRRWSNHKGVADKPIAGLAPWRARRVSDRIRHSLSDSVTLSELAASAGLSPYHFLRAFKASMGMPPHSYQLRLRMERARELLATTRLSVTEIAGQVGYDDPGYLARLFRKHYGTTPSAYRRERRA